MCVYVYVCEREGRDEEEEDEEEDASHDLRTSNKRGVEASRRLDQSEEWQG